MASDKQMPVPVVSKIDRVGPTHAEGLERLVGMNASVRQGEPQTDMRFDFELSCGIAPYQVDGHDFEMGLRTCFVSLRRTNCTLKVGTSYEYWLEPGSFKSNEVETQTLDQSRELGATLSAEGDATKGIAKIAGKLGFGASRKRLTKTESVTKKNARVQLVVVSGQDRWRVGDRNRGDARQTDGLLSGAYFREAKNSDGDAKPLCNLARTDTGVPVLVTVSVTATLGSLEVARKEATFTTGKLRNFSTLLEDSAKIASSKHEAALRARVAGLVAARAIRKAQLKAGAELKDSEFLIARQSLIILSEGESKNG
jgi:hypothetical protein